MDLLYRMFGIAGLVCIIGALLVHERKIRDILSIVGGVLLFIYSVLLGDLIFTALQALFTLVAAYDLCRVIAASRK